MSEENRELSLLNELIDGIDKGDFNRTDFIPKEYTYQHLRALFAYSDCIQDGRELFEMVHNKIMSNGINRMNKTINSGNRLRVAFVTYSATQWPAEGVYRLLEADDCMDVSIIVVALMDRDREDRISSYNQTVESFQKMGYPIVGGHDTESDIPKTWEELGGVPDIMIHLSSWNENIAPELQMVNSPLNCLHIYIPYGIYVAEGLSGNYYKEAVCDKWFSNMMWKIYIDSIENKKGLEKYQLLKGKNVVFSGYPKMDRLLKDSADLDEERIRELWSIPDGANVKDYKRVIIAPHYTVLQKGEILYSTFHYNLWFLLYVAQKYGDNVSFVFKPHPNLRMVAVKTLLFQNYDEYDEYLECWNKLPNARVVQDGDYLELFDTSDGMIMDCASFLAEYVYTLKPCLFLTRNEQRFNELGKLTFQGHYMVSGRDYGGIESFLDRVILEGVDEKKISRQQLFDQVFDYRRLNGMLASECIYKDILSSLLLTADYSKE